jgi:hypothetical protein
MADEQTSKRELLNRAAGVASMILALKIAPTFAVSSSPKKKMRRATMASAKPPGNVPVNDGPGTQRSRQHKSQVLT